MTTESLFKGAVRSFSNSFFKVAGFATALVLVFFALAVFLSSGPQRVTATIPMPDHNWRVKPFSTELPTILQIPITGEIGLERGVRKEKVAAIFQDMQALDLKPGMFKAIILTINTPGGLAEDSEAIFRMIKEYKTEFKIPVYAYIDGLCASGGTLISLAADKIIASPSSLIGHVGCIMGTHFNISKTLERLGVDTKTIYAGKHKDELSPFRPWKEDEGEDFQDLTDISYNRFVKLVVANRPRMTEEQLKEEGAKLYAPSEALEQGYIDEIKESYRETLGEIVSVLEISNRYQVIQLRPQMFLSDIFGSEASLSATRAVHHFLRLPGDNPPEFVGKPLYLYVPEAK